MHSHKYPPRETTVRPSSALGNLIRRDSVSNRSFTALRAATRAASALAPDPLLIQRHRTRVRRAGACGISDLAHRRSSIAPRSALLAQLLHLQHCTNRAFLTPVGVRLGVSDRKPDRGRVIRGVLGCVLFWTTRCTACREGPRCRAISGTIVRWFPTACNRYVLLRRSVDAMSRRS